MKKALTVLSGIVLAGGFAWAENTTLYFRGEDAAAYAKCVKSLKNIQRGELYTMMWEKEADYHLDRVLASGATSSMGVLDWICSNVLNGAPVSTVVTTLGCSAFAATNAVGEKLAGRNFDYRYDMTHALVYVPKNEKLGRAYASVSTVDCGWLGYDIGGLDDGIADLSYAALFPHLPLDGMNDAGLAISVLSLDARTNPATGEKTWMTEQFYPSRTNIVPSTAIRYLLDHAGSTAEGVRMLTEKFNMFAAIGGEIPIAANYHFYLCDKSGDARVIEWLPPAKEGESWIPFVTNATEVTNFYLADGYGHGSNRWEILRHALACREHTVSEDEAMTLCRAVSQKKGAEQTSGTHWSVVYNLTDLTANIATLGNYDEITPFAITSDAMTVGAAKSARPPIETNLPPFDPLRCESGKVYVKEEKEIGTFQGASEVMSRVGVSAVNRSGVTCDSAVAVNSRIVKADFGANRALVYVVSPVSSTQFSQWTDDAVAGVNDKGVSARVVKFCNSTGTGSMPASHALCRALVWCPGASVADMVAYLQSELPFSDATGVVFTDAKGNVAVWPKGSDLATDDASEMFRNSLDLRKGVYEIESTDLGQFDELPGLLRLASSTNTKAVVSMGYGHLDVVLPGTNLVWRAEIADAAIPHYGIVADPPAVSHATMSALTGADGIAIERNNQGRLIAQVGSELKVSYTAESGYYFANGTNQVTLTFAASELMTIPPTEAPSQPKLQLGFVAQRYPWNGIVDIKYRAANWPAGGQGVIKVRLANQTATYPITVEGIGTVNGSHAVDLAEIAPETRGQATFSIHICEGNTVSEGVESTIDVDTRKKIVILDPQEMLPIAYSTNFWAMSEQSKFGESVFVSVIDPSGKRSVIVPTTNVNGFVEWRPAIGEYGVYTLTHSVVGALSFNTSAEIHYIGKFPITYWAMGGRHADGAETNVIDAYVNKGYEFPAKDPTRDNFTFDGWFRTWSNRTEQVMALDAAASPVDPLAAHGLYALWTPISTQVTDKNIAIPDTINDLPVLAIDAYAYAQASHTSQRFETLVTPVYLQSIGKGAFQGVTTLKTLIVTPSRSFDDPSVPVSLSIGQQAFASCTALEEVRIPNEVTSIGNSAFQNCAKLKRVLFTGTNSVAYGSKAFYRCGYDNGEDELKVYMKSGFKANNAGLLTDLANWNTTHTVVPLVGVSPASGETPTISATDFGALGTARKVALLVKIPTVIPGTKIDVSAVAVKHSTNLSVWSAITPESATAAEDGTVLIEFTAPEGASGFFKIEVE